MLPILDEYRIADGIGDFAKKTLYKDKAGDKFIVGVIRDITERKEAELALQAAHGQLTEKVKLLPDATLVVDSEKKVIAWNRAMEDMTGLKNSDILGTGEYSYAASVLRLQEADADRPRNRVNNQISKKDTTSSKGSETPSTGKRMYLELIGGKGHTCGQRQPRFYPKTGM